MDSGSEVDLDGAGDRGTQSISESDKPRYVMKKLTNGIPVPVFTSSDAGRRVGDFGAIEDRAEVLRYRGGRCRSAPDETSSQTSFQTPVQSCVNVLKEFLCCPICNDPCIETTTTNCGHKFCRQCIDDWRKQKPVCPLCSTLITSLHRLYSDDLFVESQLAFLRADVKHRFKDAQEKRVRKLIEERKSRNVIKSVRKKLDNSLVYLRCKNSTGLGNRIISSSRLLYSKVSKWSEQLNLSLLVGIVIGALMLLGTRYLADSTQFLHYMWLSAKRYNGTIPEYLLPVPTPVTVSQEEGTVIDGLAQVMDFYSWIGKN